MDYSKMTKPELVTLLENQAHLSDAIEAKDQEILSLYSQLEEVNKALANQETPKIEYGKRETELLAENNNLKNALITFKNLYYNLFKLISGAIDMSSLNASFIEQQLELFFGQKKTQ